MSLVKHGSDIWYMAFQIQGQKFFRSTKTTNKALARKIEQATKDSIIAKMKLGQEAVPITLVDALNQYIETMKGRTSYKNLLSTRNVILGTHSTKCTKKFKSIYGLDSYREIHTFKNSEFELYVANRKKEGSKPSTIKQQIGVIRAAFKYANRLGFLVNDTLDLPKVKSPKTEIVYLTVEEEDRLIEALKPDRQVHGLPAPENRDCDTFQDQHDLVIMLLDTGMRAMEMCKIKWENVDTDTSELFYHSFKSKKTQTVCLTDRACEVLKRRKLTKRPDQIYVFENSTKTSHRLYNLAWFKRAVERAKLNKPVTFHKLRSSYASKLVQAGLSLMEVGQLLNHTSPSTTAIYASLIPNQASRKAAAVINQQR